MKAAASAVRLGVRMISRFTEEEKSEILISKSETISKHEYQNSKQESRKKAATAFWSFCHSRLFRASIFEFPSLDRAVRASVFREILLMIFFCAIESWRGLDLRDDRSPKTSTLFQLGQFGFSGGFLFGRMVRKQPSDIANRRRGPGDCAW